MDQAKKPKDVLEKVRQQKERNAAEVLAGTRPARSLWHVKPGSLRGVEVREQPGAEYSKPGEGW